ncbi:hypothetical protein [Nocardia inohanensis]|uniref:hypothetical protein n=1 Tax=Nocardia inohanensis TaxID=209246 RepID=UPI000A01B1ED|nr:hypothetical protein [Nocardia inohanensis]
MARFLGIAASTAAAAGALTLVVPLAIWPGEAKLTAPMLCSPATEPMVVSDTMHDSEGTSVNYTLYCVGQRGEFTDAGFALPMLILFAAHLTILAAFVMAVSRQQR